MTSLYPFTATPYLSTTRVSDDYQPWNLYIVESYHKSNLYTTIKKDYVLR